MKELLKKLPKVDRLLVQKQFDMIPNKIKKQLIVNEIERTREDILSNKIDSLNEDIIIKNILSKYQKLKNGSLKNVINATGITIHTNLGRSPISEEIFESIKKITTRYCNLEYDLTLGKRGSRHHHLNEVGSYLFGDYELLLVNNNAAAVFLVLNTFSKNKYTIVSRGELVEIGGGFRIPEVMANSSALLKEIGTTNKTRIKDYQNAISEDSALVMKVHQSNFSIEGFTESASLEEIVTLSKESNLISYYDLGSGMVEPLSINKNEPIIEELCKIGLDIISFSTDKLLGSIQGGIILAKKEHMQELKQNQLLRMLRADKITIALTEATLQKYILSNANEILTYNMLSISLDELEQKAYRLQQLLSNFIDCKTIKTKTYAGGGSMPNKDFDSFGVSLSVENIKEYEKVMRQNNIIVRLENEKIILDVRTIFENEFVYIAEVIKAIKN